MARRDVVGKVDYVGKTFKKGMSSFEATTSLRRDGITYYIEVNDMYGTNTIATWWDDSDNGFGYNNYGDVYVDNPFNRMTGSFSPENIDQYLRVSSAYDRSLPMPIKKAIINRVKKYIDYDALNDIRRSQRTESVGRKSNKLKISEDVYEITYDYDDEWSGVGTSSETFEGSWQDLQDYIKQLRASGCYNIDAACVDDCYESYSGLNEGSEEIARKLFVSLVKLYPYGYSVLNDGNFVCKIAAKDDEDAIRQFNDFLKTDWKSAWRNGTLPKYFGESKKCVLRKRSRITERIFPDQYQSNIDGATYTIKWHDGKGKYYVQIPCARKVLWSDSPEELMGQIDDVLKKCYKHESYKGLHEQQEKDIEKRKQELRKKNDFEKSSPYRRAVLAKQFINNSNPYVPQAMHCIVGYGRYGDFDEQEFLAADWEEQRKKFIEKYGRQFGISEGVKENTPNIGVKHEGILEVPEGKNVDDLPISHFEKLAKKKGLSKITKALNNLQVWNKNDDPKLSKWAGDMIDKLNKKLKKEESYNSGIETGWKERTIAVDDDEQESVVEEILAYAKRDNDRIEWDIDYNGGTFAGSRVFYIYSDGDTFEEIRYKVREMKDDAIYGRGVYESLKENRYEHVHNVEEAKRGRKPKASTENSIARFLDAQIDNGAIDEKQIVVVHDKNNNIMWLGKAGFYPLYMQDITYKSSGYDADHPHELWINARSYTRPFGESMRRRKRR